LFYIYTFDLIAVVMGALPALRSYYLCFHVDVIDDKTSSSDEAEDEPAEDAVKTNDSDGINIYYNNF
jgi:hypothetical protein